MSNNWKSEDDFRHSRRLGGLEMSNKLALIGDLIFTGERVDFFLDLEVVLFFDLLFSFKILAPSDISV